MPNNLSSIRCFALYYGSGHEEWLSQHDLAIVAPAGHTPDGLRHMKDAGTKVLAYVPVLEVPQEPGVAPPPNVLRNAGTPWTNPDFGNWVLDPRAPATRGRLLQEAERLLQQGYDGLFLDTVADVEEFPCAPRLRSELVTAMAWLTTDLSRQARCTLVQNRGFDRLAPLTASCLDGVCWEAFPFRRIGPNPAVHAGIRSVQRLQRYFGLQVLALNEGTMDGVTQEIARQAAQRCGFLWYGTPDYVSQPAGSGRVVS